MKQLRTNGMKISGGLIFGVPIRYMLVCLGFFLGGIFAGMMGGILVLFLGLFPAVIAYLYSLHAKGKAEGYTTNMLRSLVASKYINPTVEKNPWEDEA